MNASTFIAGILGPLYILVGAGALINGDYYRKMLSAFVGNTGLYYFSAILAVVLGLVMVQVHNLWVADWRVVITLIGWMSLLKGVVRVLFPTFGADFAESFAEEKTSLVGLSVICIIFGSWLTYLSFGSAA